MAIIPFKSRIPLEVWLIAAFFTIISTVSSVIAGPAVGLNLAQAVQCTLGVERGVLGDLP
jgi:hypothetical protein